MGIMETFHVNTTRQGFPSKFKFSIDPREDLAKKTMYFICLNGKISNSNWKKLHLALTKCSMLKTV